MGFDLDYHEHNWVDKTEILCENFQSVALDLGAPMMEFQDRQRWVEEEGYKELARYQKGYRAYICKLCGLVRVFNLHSNE